jgi:protocatechuate 3,4-dioxygenase beta subunit
MTDRPISRRVFGQGIAAALLTGGIARIARADCILTTNDIQGPYYVSGAPQRTVIASADEPGTRLFISGRVFSTRCDFGVGGVLVDVWQASNAGCYSISQVCPDEDPWNLRGQMLTDANGNYAIETILPGYYPGRCRHIHWRFFPIGGPLLITQLYFAGDPQIPNDPYASRPEAAARIIPLTQEADGLHGTWDLVLDLNATDAGDEGPDPEITFLHPGFPNPFRGETNVRFSLAQASSVELSVYDVTGRRVAMLLEREMPVGYHTVTWDGRDERGQDVRPGVYFVQLIGGGKALTKKMIRAE